VIDASLLSRSLELTLELLELEAPMLLCLNMMDEAERKGSGLTFRNWRGSSASPSSRSSPPPEKDYGSSSPRSPRCGKEKGREEFRNSAKTSKR